MTRWSIASRSGPTRRGLLIGSLLPRLAAAIPPPAVIAGLVPGLCEPGSAVAEQVRQLLRRPDAQALTWMPWARAFSTAQAGNSLLFPMVRLPEREAAWQWLAPLQRDELVLVLGPGVQVDLQDPTALRRLRIGAIRSSLILARLKALGVITADLAPSELANAKKLALGRIQAWITLGSVASAAALRPYLPERARLMPLDARPLMLWLAATPDVDVERLNLGGVRR